MALDGQNRNSLEACIEESRKHLVHMHVRVYSHTHTHTHTHDSPSVIHSWKEHSPNYPKAPLGVLHPIRSNSWGGGGHRKKEKGNNKAVDFSHLTPPPSTFSTSLLPSFASPVNAIKRKSMSDPLGT